MGSSSRAIGFSCILAAGLSTRTAKSMQKKKKKTFLKTEFKTLRLLCWTDYWTISVRKKWSSTESASRYPFLQEKAEMGDRALPYWQCCGFAAGWVWVCHVHGREPGKNLFCQRYFSVKHEVIWLKHFFFLKKLANEHQKTPETKIASPKPGIHPRT